MNTAGKREAADVDWAAAEAEYINSSVPLAALAEKYGVSKSAAQKQSAKRKWSAKRKKLRQDKADKLGTALHDKDIKSTAKSIERCCRAADKLLDKITRAIAQVDKSVYVSFDSREERVKTEQNGEEEVTYSTRTRNMKTKRINGLIDTRKLSDIAKSLLSVKQILTGEDGTADKTESRGIIELVAADVIDKREDENEDGVDASAAPGGNDGEA